MVLNHQMLSIRVLNQADHQRLYPLVQRTLEWDVCPLETLAQKLNVDEDQGLGLVAEIGGRPIGFLQGGMGRGSYQSTAFIRFGMMDRAYRNRGYASSLLRQLEERFKQRGATQISTMDCPHNYFQPGVDFRATEVQCFLIKHEYQFFRSNHNLIASLPLNSTNDLESKLLQLQAKGLRIALGGLEDFSACAEFVSQNWEPWIYEIRQAMENPEGCVWLAWRGTRVVGFAACGGNNPGLPWFGPMGTDPQERSVGIGGLLFRLCMEHLTQKGYGSAIIPWAGPIRFYSRYANAHLNRCFWVHRKAILPGT